MMDCFGPLAPNDEELLRHVLDGDDLSPGAKEHVEQCSICQQRIARYTSTNSLLLSKLYRSICPDVTLLSHYCVGLLAANKAREIAHHLKVCPLCANEVADTRRMLKNFEIFPDAMTSSFPTSQRDVANPVPWQPYTMNESGMLSTQKHMWPCLYRTDTIAISLHLARDAGGCIFLLGLLSSAVTGACIEIFVGARVELYRGMNTTLLFGEERDIVFSEQDIQGPLLTTYVDELGRLVFKNVLPGPYLMIVYLPETEVVIEDLEVELE